MKQPARRSLRAVILAGVAILIFALFAHDTILGKIRAWWRRNYCEVRIVNNSDWFDYPVGAPNARGYYKAQGFGGPRQHLGEDWNGIGGGDSDYGDPIYAVADGRVVSARDCGGGWGNVVRIDHTVRGSDAVEALYAHLAEMRVCEGEMVRRGQVIGTMGNVGGLYAAHLHFEIRRDLGLPLGGGYGENCDGAFCDPTAFIDEHRRKHDMNEGAVDSTINSAE